MKERASLLLRHPGLEPGPRSAQARSCSDDNTALPSRLGPGSLRARDDGVSEEPG
jgi:hypothetical protein